MTRQHALPTLDVAVEWLRDHWDEQRPAPIRLHDARQTEGELGGLPYSGEFVAALSWSPGEVRRVSMTGLCPHPMTHGRGEDCPECQGTGVRDVTVDRYTYPMTMALARLAHVVAPRLWPHPLAMIFTLAEHGWSTRLVRRLLDAPPDLFEVLMLRAIRQLHDRYQAAPIPKPGWVDLSDSQRSAVLAGEAANA